jgi:heme-degrading monooxygenase HmoA
MSPIQAWTRSDAFRRAHRDAGSNKPLYLGHPEFEGFEVLQTVKGAPFGALT